MQGLDAMDYKEHIDYDLKESTNPAFGKAIVRVNIYRQHRQVDCLLGSTLNSGRALVCQTTMAICVETVNNSRDSRS